MVRWRWRRMDAGWRRPRPHRRGMPTPNERRALIFLAALGALGVGVRAFRSAPATSQGARGAGESRAALGRQIDAVDSATLAKRSASGRGRSQRAGTPAVRSQLPKSGATESRAGRAALDRRAQDVPPPDPLALYERRRLDVARRNRDVQARIERDRAGTGSAAVSPPPPGRAPSQPGSFANAVRDRELVDVDTADAAAIASLPSIGPVLAARIVADRSARGAFGSLAGLQRVRGVGPALAAKIGQFVTFSRSGSAGERIIKLRAVRVRPNRP